ncbi:MAG: TolC family protein, partial [Verrucomicrobia subdivision 3 bacterium]|nr:TolC family protein [Limisphaerales bacterium]
MKIFMFAAFGLTALLAGCAVGPDYERPATSVPATYKSTNALGAWKEGRPLDNVPKGNWWEIFGDATLNELERQANEANQELKAAVARVEQARAVARVARGELLPLITADPSFRRER